MVRGSRSGAESLRERASHFMQEFDMRHDPRYHDQVDGSGADGGLRRGFSRDRYPVFAIILGVARKLHSPSPEVVTFGRVFFHRLTGARLP
jgi:hypothetical protein